MVLAARGLLTVTLTVTWANAGEHPETRDILIRLK